MTGFFLCYRFYFKVLSITLLMSNQGQKIPVCPPYFRHDDPAQFINLDLVSAPFKLLFQRNIRLPPESG
jgi:hypothetical protein